MKKLLPRLLPAMLCLSLVLAACAPSQPSSTPESQPDGPAAPASGIDFEADAREVIVTDTDVTFTDSLDQTVTINKNPQRVVSLLNSYTGLWYQAGGVVVGRLESETELPPEALDPSIKTVGRTAASVSAELLLDLQPDLVLLRASWGDELLGQLEQNEIPYIAIEYNGFADYLKWLKVFTALNGTDELYETSGTALFAEIDATIAALPTEEGPTVMLMFGTTSSVKAYLSNTAVGEMLSQLGAVNIADRWEETTATSVEMNTEYLITADPDYILVQCMGEIDKVKEYIDGLYGAEGWWNALSAVKSGNVVYLDRSLFHYKPNARYAEAYGELAKILYK